MIGAVELGLLYAVMAIGVYLTFRVLDFPDLTVDGSFTTGAAAAGVLITNGVNPFIATGVGFLEPVTKSRPKRKQCRGQLVRSATGTGGGE